MGQHGYGVAGFSAIDARNSTVILGGATHFDG
jgi:hypothetical protein